MLTLSQMVPLYFFVFVCLKLPFLFAELSALLLPSSSFSLLPGSGASCHAAEGGGLMECQVPLAGWVDITRNSATATPVGETRECSEPS